MTRTFLDLPRPWGRTIVPRTSWSALRGSTPSQTVNSTVSSNLANAISLSFVTASSRLYLRPTSIFSAAALYFFPCFFISLLRGACGASNASLVMVPGVRFQVSEEFRRPAPDTCHLLFNRQSHLPGGPGDRLD